MSKRLDSLEHNGVVSVLYLIRFDLYSPRQCPWNLSSSSKLYQLASTIGPQFFKVMPSYYAKAVIEGVKEINARGIRMPVNLSLQDVFSGDHNIDDPFFQYSAISLLTVPKTAISHGMDTFSDEELYHLYPNPIEDFQIQYSIVLTPDTEPMHLVMPAYKPLYDAMKKFSARSVVNAVKSIYRLGKTNPEKEQFLKKLESKPPQNEVLFYKMLRDQPFTNPQNQLLTQGILNAMALSPGFVEKIRDLKASALPSLQLPNILSTLPTVILQIINEYLLDEEQDVTNRRSYVF
jgi:hypothetical protein